MRGDEVILLNFPISHFLKSLAHSALETAQFETDLKPTKMQPRLVCDGL